MNTPVASPRALFALPVLLALAASAWGQTLPTGVTVKPFYDTSKAGLSFAKDKQSVVGMYEVPGKPQHFLVVGYWGYVWSLYPDTSKAYAADAPWKDYAKKQIADFNNAVMKGWEQGALGGAFDPDFARNRFFYIIYNKYADPSKYHGGVKPTSVDGPGAAGLVAVERWKLSEDYAALTRDTTLFVADHSTGYGSSNIVFGVDGMLYITTDSYSQNSWDSTTYMRKILRIDVSRQDPGKLYAIPKDNPFYKVSNPNVKKEIFAFGFRNTYSLTADYLTGRIWGAEVGQGTWEEVNLIHSGKNYGWGDGGDGQPSSSGSGIEGPCTQNTAAGNAFSGGLKAPYSFTGAQSQGRTFTCGDFTNGTWNFNHGGKDAYGSATALPGLSMSCIILGPAFRGDPASPFYGHHFVTDVARNYFVALKEGGAAPQNVGSVPKDMVFSGDKAHNGITSFAEDSFGNMYVTMLSSSSTGAYAWHDIYRISHPQLKPLAVPRNQVVPTAMAWRHGKADSRMEGAFGRLVTGGSFPRWIRLPQGRTRAELYAMDGRLLWTGKVKDEAEAGLLMPEGLETGAAWVRYLP